MTRVVQVPSPAIAFVGRHNSGKTTLLEKLIANLTERGVDVGTIKHHGHPSFDIDYPGKDSFRHRQAGASETIIVSRERYACVRELTEEPECSDLVRSMPGHDIVLVEGYRRSGLPTMEIIRQANERDAAAADEFMAKGTINAGAPLAVITDRADVREAAASRGVLSFGLEDVQEICDYLIAHHVRQKLTVVIQAGGESRRMGRSKALVPFLGRPLIERMVDRLAPVADELVITTNEPEKLAFLLERTDVDVRLERDVLPERGALRGLYTALSQAGSPLVATVACDMVFASARLIVAEAVKLAETGCDAVVPHNKHGFEPFHAVYRRKTCLPAVKRALDEGHASAKSFFDSVDVLPFEREEVLAAEPRGGCFINVNTPEELHAVEASILGDED